jgi:hypothetical protein
MHAVSLGHELPYSGLGLPSFANTSARRLFFKHIKVLLLNDGINKKAIFKKRGRPATGSRIFRLTDEFIAELDAWAAAQDDKPGRSEAIHRLVELGLKVKSILSPDELH